MSSCISNTSNTSAVSSVEDEYKETSSLSSSSFRVIYGAGEGRAECIRLAGFYGDIAFEDSYLSINEHSQQKADGVRRWAGLPELIIFDVNGNELIKIGQSNSCLRYVGSLSNLYPKNPLYRALCDEILDSSNDFIVIIAKIMMGPFENDDEKKQAVDEFMSDNGEYNYWLQKFENRLQENKKRGYSNGYFVGDTITIADLKVIGMFGSTGYVQRINGAPEIIKKYVLLSKWINIIENDNKIKEARKQFKMNYDAHNAATNSKPPTADKDTIYKYAGKYAAGSL